MAFEEEFDIKIPDEDAEKIRTVADTVSYLQEHLSPEASEYNQFCPSSKDTELDLDRRFLEK